MNGSSKRTLFRTGASISVSGSCSPLALLLRFISKQELLVNSKKSFAAKKSMVDAKPTVEVPDEILLSIFGLLRISTRCVVSLVCVKW